MQNIIDIFHDSKGIKISYFGSVIIDIAYYPLQYVIMQNPVVMEKTDDNNLNPFQSLYISNLMKDCITAYEKGDTNSCAGGVFEQILSALKEPLILFLKDKPEEYQRIVNSFNKDLKPLIKEYILDWLKSEGKQKRQLDENGIVLKDEAGNPILIDNDLRSDFLKNYTGTAKEKEEIPKKLLKSFTNFIKTKMNVDKKTEKVIAEVFEEEYKKLFEDGVIDLDDPNSFGYNGGKKRKTQRRRKRKTNKTKKKTNKKQ